MTFTIKSDKFKNVNTAELTPCIGYTVSVIVTRSLPDKCVGVNRHLRCVDLFSCAGKHHSNFTKEINISSVVLLAKVWDTLHNAHNTHHKTASVTTEKHTEQNLTMSICEDGRVNNLDNLGDAISAEYISNTTHSTAFIYATSISTNGGEEYIRYYRNKLSILHPGSLNATKAAIGYGYTSEDVSKGGRNRVRYVNSSRDSFRKGANLYCRGQNKSRLFTIFPSIGPRNIGRDGKGVHNGNSSRRHLEANKALGAYY